MRYQPFEFPIFVNRPFLPPLKEYTKLLEPLWEDKFLSNFGPRLRCFEELLCKYLQSPNVNVVSNGTLALQLAVDALDLSGEIITTPFSFAATALPIKRNMLTPRFVDVEKKTFNIDPECVEAGINENTTAIIAVHVFGLPCAHDALSSLAEKYNLKLLYDAAHAFGVHVNGYPITNWGDISMVSMHATKPFHTVEGGLLVHGSEQLKQRIDKAMNFGFEPNGDVSTLGMNAKMNEFQASMGLLMLDYIDEIIDARLRICRKYTEALEGLDGIDSAPILPPNVQHNGSFYPILVQPQFGLSRDELVEELLKFNVHPKKYFSPLISEMSLFREEKVVLPVAEELSQKVLVLPVHTEMTEDDAEKIAGIIRMLRR